MKFNVKVNLQNNMLMYVRIFQIIHTLEHSQDKDRGEPV